MAKVPKEDPVEKLRGIMREEIEGSEKNRQRKELEAKDPGWGVLRGIIREETHAVLDEREKAAKERKPKESEPDDGDGQILGGLFGGARK